MFRALPLLLSILLLGCGEAKPTAVASPGVSPVAIPTFAISPGPIPTPGNSGIVQLQVAAALAADGSAQAPTTTFNHSTDRKIIAVLQLANVPAGSKISYVRYLDGKFVDSKSATTTKTDKHFYFTFTALTGKDFAVGQYRLRVYLNEHAVQEAAYRVQ